MILTVTPNPAIDMTYRIDAFEAGASLRVDTGLARAGGKGVNVARVARQTGHAVLALTTAGGATGRELADELEASALPHRLVSVAAATRRSIAIVDSASGSTTIMNERGAALAHTEVDALLDEATALLPDARCLVGSGSLPPGAPDTFYADLVIAAKRQHVPTVIDAVGAALLAAAEAGADVVKPNRVELRATTGEDDPIAGARRLIDAGARVVLVSLGEEGMLALGAQDPAHPLLARLPRVLDGNPTGAGDAAVAAVASVLVAPSTQSSSSIRPSGGHDDTRLRTLLTRATAWSAAAVLAPVAGEIAENYPELEQLLSVGEWPNAAR